MGETCSAAVPVVQHPGEVPALQGLPVDEEVAHPQVAPADKELPAPCVTVQLEQKGIQVSVLGLAGVGLREVRVAAQLVMGDILVAAAEQIIFIVVLVQQLEYIPASSFMILTSGRL